MPWHFQAAQTVLQIIHGAAGPFTGLVFPAVVDAQNAFGIAGHHTEKGGYPHPEYRAGTAGGDGGGYTGNVAYAYCGRKRGAKRLKLRNRGFFMGMTGDFFIEKTAYRAFQPVADIAELKATGAQRHPDSGP